VLACLLVTALLPAFAGTQSDKDAAKRQEADAIIERALSVSDIRAEGSAEFGMRGTITVNGAKKHAAEGTYLLLWMAPDRWREEIQFQDYSRMRVGTKNQYWQTRSIDYELLPINGISVALSFPGRLRSILQSTPDKGTLDLAKRKIHGRTGPCVLFTPEKGHVPDQAYCFDAENGALISEEHAPWNGAGDVEYSDFVSFGGKIFPGTIQLKMDGRAEAQFHVSGLSPLGQVDPKAFDAPPNAAEFGDCEEGNHPTPLHGGVPRYPEEMKREHVSGNVYVYALIGTDGKLHNMKVLPESDQRFVTATLPVMATWDYAPSSCGDVETIVATVFRMGD
jgi:Gram-negative bacterial TonB protein C-terminal